MQTFLPYPSFVDSAMALDSKRLWKQVLEADGILRTLRGLNDGWKNHPATLMWKGYDEALERYITAMVEEWLERRLLVPPSIHDHYSPTGVGGFYPQCPVPTWLGDEAFHASHRAVLLGKAQEALDRAMRPLIEMRLGGLSEDQAERQQLRYEDYVRRRAEGLPPTAYHIDQTKRIKVRQAANQWAWYHKQGWTEEPATKVNGSWPYVWPVTDKE